MNRPPGHTATLRRKQERLGILCQLDHDSARVPAKIEGRGVALLLLGRPYTHRRRTFWKLIFNFRFHDRYLAAHELREVLGVINRLRVGGF